MAKIKLFDNVSGSGTITGDAKKGDGGDKVITAYADDFGGGTITLEINTIDPTIANAWVPVTFNGSILSITANISYYLHKIAQSQYIRAKMTGATAASNVNVVLN